MRRSDWFIRRLFFGLGAFALAMVAAAAERLPGLEADRERLTVSGLSSGAYMAVQYAVAHSSRVNGVGVFAGGPYYCVGINPTRAETVCMQGSPGADGSIRDAERLASLRLIDPTQNLRRMRAWLLAGASDKRVVEPVVRASAEFFAHYNKAGTQFRVQPGLGHGLPTPTHGVACATSASPYINRCGAEFVGEMLASLQAGTEKAIPGGGRLIVFNQSEFVPAWRRWGSMSSLSSRGYAFVPAACERDDARCRIHIALHGCHQGDAEIGEVFMRQSGYIEWGAAHATIMLFPQAQPSMPAWFAWWLPINPNGCWDWWGYTGTDYAVKTGVQIKAITAMVDRLASPRGVR
jgi:pimeloyl-ACP methyl ester carboxylesterase